MRTAMDAAIRLLSQKEVLGPLIAAFGGLAVFYLGAITTRSKERRQRRQDIYAEAYKVVLSWREMVYRVRRRRTGEDAEAGLVLRFHELQEQLDYFQGWISTESVWIARSFCRFAAKVKFETHSLLQEAWKETPIPAKTSLSGLAHPSIERDATAFLFDVRAHLSPWFHVWMKVPMVARNVDWSPIARRWNARPWRKK